MRLCFLADPLNSFKIWKDSTYAMMLEASRRGYPVYAFEQKDMFMRDGQVLSAVSRISLLGEDPSNWYRIEECQELSLDAFDAIIVRKDPPFDMEYVYLTYLLEHASSRSARIFNKPDAIRNHSEKLSITEFSQFIAPTLVSSNGERIRDFHAKYHDVILKPLNEMGGAGVFRIQADGMNFGSVIEMLTDNGRKTIMTQKFIPEIEAGDKRVLLIDGEVVPYLLARMPMQGEIRANLAAGGIGVTQSLSARDREIAETLAPILAKRGLFLVGLDIIGDYLTEINVTSPTCFREITEQSGFDVAAMFMDRLEKSLGQG